MDSTEQNANVQAACLAGAECSAAASSKDSMLTDPHRKPQTLSVIPENIPAVLKEKKQFVGFIWEWRKNSNKQRDTLPGRWTKPPINVKTGRKAKVNDESTWVTFDEAMEAYRTGGIDGIGVVLRGGAGVDLDGCVDEDGTIAEWAREVVFTLDTYAERSPTGTGIKLYMFGALPRGAYRKGHVEMYDDSSARYFTLTGHRLPGSPATINERQAQLAAVHAKYLGKAKTNPEQVSSRAAKLTSMFLTDADLIAKASNANVTGPKFKYFMSGDIRAYRSQSEADLAFCNLIAFWTDDAEQVRRIVQQSAMNREKWDRDDYAERTIKKAFDGRTSRYDPAHYGQARHGRNGHTTTNGSHQRAPSDPFDKGVTEVVLDSVPPSEPHADSKEQRPANPEADRVCMTDLGNGKRFAADHGEIIRYCHPWKRWLIWDGIRWKLDTTGHAMTLAKRTVLGLYEWVQQNVTLLRDDDSAEGKLRLAQINAVLQFALRSQHVNRLKAMLDLARSEPGIPILPDVLDADPWIFNCINGTIDLRTGKLRPHAQKDYLTKLCPVAFNPAATCPIFIKTVNSIFNNDNAFIEYAKRFHGYGLTGNTSEHVVPIAYGGGSNGKTLFYTAIQETMGSDYSGTVSSELLMESHGDQHPTIKADLFGKRLMVLCETKKGGCLNVERVKALSGSDRVKARRMKEDFWEFAPTHKLVVCTNHRPNIVDNDHGIWRRLALLPFIVRFWDLDKGETGPPELQADKALSEKLTAEREGILAWLVAGCLAWQHQGMVTPAAVRAATAEYRSDEDKLGEFLTERCHLNREFRVRVSDLYGDFKQWCEANGETKSSGTAFGNALAERGFSKDAGKRWYLGLKLSVKDEADTG